MAFSGGGVCAAAPAMAQKKSRATFRIDKITFNAKTNLMNRCTNNNRATVAALCERRRRATNGGHRPPPQEMIPPLYVHIPVCAPICPYCAFYKKVLYRSPTERFC